MMTQYEIHYRLAEKIIFPEHRKFSCMCQPCQYKMNCNTIMRIQCIDQLAQFIHITLLDILGDEYEILQLKEHP